METVIQILMLFIVVGAAFKLSFASRTQTLIYALCCALFLIGTYGYSIEQTKDGIQAYVTDKALREQAAILTTVESLLFIAFCFLSLAPSGNDERGKWRGSALAYRLLRFYPCLMLLPVLFYLQTTLIFSLPGIDFSLISYALAGATLVGIPLLTWGVRTLLPERELRLEVCFLVSLFVFVCGVITTVDDSLRYAPLPTQIELDKLLMGLAGFALLFGLGFYMHRIKALFTRKPIVKHKA